MTIRAVEELIDEFGPTFATHILCSGGLKWQWANQIAQFTGGTQDEDGQWHGGTPCIVIDGPPDKRRALYQRVLDEVPNYVIIGYDQVVDENSAIRALPRNCVVVDEITAIKSPEALVTMAIRDTYGETPFRYGLTATPMENGRPEEMFQIMVFIDDTVLGRADIFDATFVVRNKWGSPVEYRNLDTFHDLMKECSWSVDSDDPTVAPYMPTMHPTHTVLVELDDETARVYDLMAGDLTNELDTLIRMGKSFDVSAHYLTGRDGGEQQGKIMSRITCMRMLCAHPDELINSARTYIAAEAKRDADPGAWPMVTKRVKGNQVKVPKPLPGSGYAAELYRAGELWDLTETPKMDEACHDIDESLAGKCWCCTERDDANFLNKIVVFSFHKWTLHMLERRYPGISVRYDGSMSLKKREANKKRFQRDPDVRLFLTSDAGGYGVDLPQGNHLFNYDKPYTTGRVTQRNARIHRAVTTFHQDVFNRDYLVAGSIEEYYAASTDAKAKVVRAVRTGRGTVKGSIKMDANSLGNFLRSNQV